MHANPSSPPHVSPTSALFFPTFPHFLPLSPIFPLYPHFSSDAALCPINTENHHFPPFRRWLITIFPLRFPKNDSLSPISELCSGKAPVVLLEGLDLHARGAWVGWWGVAYRGRRGVGMTPGCLVLVCSWQRPLADRHSPPFPWTLSLHRRWCPSASHHPVTFFFLPTLTFPLPFPFLSLGLPLHRPWCPSASHHPFPFHSLGRLCQRSPRTCPVSLLCVKSTQRKANAFAVGQVRPSGHPKPAVRPWDDHLRGHFPDGGT